MAIVRLILFTFLLSFGVENSFAQLSFPGQQGGSKVVKGDAFGKFYGKGVGGLSGWNESNPFGIAQTLSGPTLGHCPKSERYNGDDDDGRDFSNLDESEDSYEPASPLVYGEGTTDGADLDPGRDYAGEMGDVIDVLRKIQNKRCEGGDTTLSDCKNRASGDKRSGRCWQAVKIALKDAGVVDSYISSAAAIDAHREGLLTKAGFCQVKVDNSSKAPTGAILVYRWNQSRVDDWNDSCSKQPSCRVSVPKYGHIEVKASENEYLSDIELKVPMDMTSSNSDSRGPKRTLEAVYVKGPCNDE